MTARASRTASSFGLRVLPTATTVEFIGKFEPVGAFTAGFAFGRRRVKLGPVNKWSGIRESNSRLHLGKVAYYHYTNPAYGATTRRPKTFIAWRSRGDKSAPETRIRTENRRKLRQEGAGEAEQKKPATLLIDFHDARGFHDRRFLLAFGKPLSTFAVNIDASELFAVVIVHGYLPVAMFTPSILVEPARTLFFCPGFNLRFLHDEMALDAGDDGNFDLVAQVAR